MKATLRLASVLFLAASSLLAASAPTPSEFLKFEVGADRKLADCRQITAYFRALEKASPRVKYGFDSKSLDNKTIKAGKLSESFDVIVLPDVGKQIIANGRPKSEEGAA